MSRSEFIPASILDYVTRYGLRESAELARLREETETMRERGFMVARESGLFVAFLLELIGAERSLDVGTFTGYSSLAAAQAMGPNGRVVTFDTDETFTAIARRHWRSAGVDSQIELILGPAETSLTRLRSKGLAGAFDFAFIDADKASYPAYVESCLSLLRPGGLIAIDNVLWKGAVAAPTHEHDRRTAGLHALNANLRDDSRVSMILLPIGDGLTLLRKRL